MSYEVKLRPAAQKELDALSEQDYERVAEAINTLVGCGKRGVQRGDAPEPALERSEGPGV